MFGTKSRKEVFQYQKPNANAAKQPCNNEMLLTQALIEQVMENPSPDIKNHDDLAEWCAMSRGELQNWIAWCFERFADFTGHADHDQDFSHLNHAKNSRYSAVEIPAAYFQCAEQAVHMVRCTESKRWRKNKPPWYDTVLVWMGSSPNSHFKSTAGPILTGLKSLLIVEDAEWSITGSVALVQTFATGPIRQTAGVVIVEDRHQPPMQPLSNGTYCHMPPFGVGMKYIVPICAMLGAVHLLHLTPQPDCMWWYLSDMIYLNAFNSFYMWIIQFDAWSNHCIDISKSHQSVLWVSKNLFRELCQLVYNRCLEGLNS